MAKTTDLTPEHELFCLEYIKDFNGSRAYKAVYKCKAKTAVVSASKLLTKVNIQNRLAKLIEKRAERVEISVDRVLEEAKRIAFADVQDAFNSEGGLKDLKDWPEDLRRGVSSFEVEELFEGRGEQREQIGVLKKVKFWSKDKQIENLMRHLGMFEKDNKQAAEAGIKSLADLVLMAAKSQRTQG